MTSPLESVRATRLDLSPQNGIEASIQETAPLGRLLKPGSLKSSQSTIFQRGDVTALHSDTIDEPLQEHLRKAGESGFFSHIKPLPPGKERVS
jgi:hypothetical protein